MDVFDISKWPDSFDESTAHKTAVTTWDGITFGFAPERPVALDQETANFFRDLYRRQTGKDAPGGVTRDDMEIYRLGDIVSTVVTARELLTNPVHLNRLDAVQLDALVRNERFWDGLEDLGYACHEAEGKRPSNRNPFSTEIRLDVTERRNRAVLELEVFEAHGWRERWALRDYLTGNRHEPRFTVPSEDEMETLRKEGVFDGRGLFKSTERSRERALASINDDAIKALVDPNAPVMKPIEAVHERRAPVAYSWSAFVRQSVRDITDFERQMKETGRYEGYFVRKDDRGDEEYLICEVGDKGFGKSICFIECSEALEEMKAGYASGVVEDGGKTYAVDEKAMGELASGRTVELRCNETGEYASFAYSIKDNRIAQSASFNERMKDALKTREKEAVKKAIKESRDKKRSEGESAGTKKGVK